MRISSPPPPKRKLQTLAFTIACIAMVFIDTQVLDFKQWLLIAVAVCGYLYFGLFEWKIYKAKKAWEKDQPVDTSLVGAPQLPHVRQCISFMIGLSSFLILGSLWMPHKETGLAGNEWWMLVLIPIAVAGFWYARNIQKTYHKAFMEWRQAQSRKSA